MLRRRWAEAFTLVEMLVVVSIILIAVAVVLPALTSLATSASRRGGISQVLAALDQARATAIAQGGNVYVAFADANPLIPEDYRYRSFAVFQQVYYPEQKASGNPYFFELVRPWTKLPEGVAFKPDTSSERSLFSGARQKFYFRLSKDNSGGGELDLPFLKFNGIGGLESANGSALTAEFARVRLFEGYFMADGTPVAGTAAGEKSNAVLEVSIFTGRAAKREEADAS